MKVSLYELLGMIKDEKAPKNIRVYGNFWAWDKEQKDYIQKNTKPVIFGLFCNYLENEIINSLNDEVEIIEENKKIEKLNIHQEKNCKNNWKWQCNGYNISTPQKIIGEKLNEIIDKLNEMENKND